MAPGPSVDFSEQFVLIGIGADAHLLQIVISDSAALGSLGTRLEMHWQRGGVGGKGVHWSV